MFDIGWSEMAVIALIALIVIGPKELPHAMRSASKWIRKARSLAREFQSGVDEMIREADLDDARKAIDGARDFDVGKTIEDTIDPTGGVRKEAQDLESAAHDTDTEDTAPADAAAPADAHDETAAREPAVVREPLNIAPAHSVTQPPTAEPAAETVDTAAGDAGDSKRA